MKNISLVVICALAFAIASCKKSKSGKGLELVFSDNTYQLTGVAKDPGGKLWVNYPRWSEIYKYAVVTGQGTDKAPFPDEVFNNWQPGQDGMGKWVCVQSVYVDDNGTLWVLDPAAPMLKTIEGNGAKLVRMNKNTGSAERSYSFIDILPDTAYVNDVRVDVQKNFAYLTESKGGGLIVVDLSSGNMRRVLSTHYSVKIRSCLQIHHRRQRTHQGREARQVQF